MADCWKQMPDKRPSFEQLIATLEQMMTKDTLYADFEKLDENEPYCSIEVTNSSESSGGLDSQL